jgi:hypothetical protein
MGHTDRNASDYPGLADRHGRSCGLVALTRDEAAGVVARLRSAGIRLDPVSSWGDHMGYAAIRHTRPALLLLDVPGYRASAALDRHVTALRTLGPVLVLVDPQRARTELPELNAGDIVDRDAPATELAERVRARLHGLDRGERTTQPAATSASLTVQDFLLEWLLTMARPLCCHELRWLLGQPGRPLSLAAVRARLQRLAPLLTDRGATILETRRWGRDCYTVLRLKDGGHPRPGTARPHQEQRVARHAGRAG